MQIPLGERSGFWDQWWRPGKGGMPISPLSHHPGLPPVPWPCRRVCLSICSLQEEGDWFGAPPGGMSAARICGLGSGH